MEDRPAEELDVVELLRDFPEHGLRKGQRATIVDVPDDPDVVLLEFSDDQGRGFAFPNVDRADFRVVWRIRDNTSVGILSTSAGSARDNCR
jgi:hypothetical protein